MTSEAFDETLMNLYGGLARAETELANLPFTEIGSLTLSAVLLATLTLVFTLPLGLYCGDKIPGFRGWKSCTVILGAPILVAIATVVVGILATTAGLEADIASIEARIAYIEGVSA